MTDLTARIVALEAQGYDLFAVRHYVSFAPGRELDCLLTALEQAQARVRHAIEVLNDCQAEMGRQCARAEQAEAAAEHQRERLDTVDVSPSSGWNLTVRLRLQPEVFCSERQQRQPQDTEPSA